MNTDDAQLSTKRKATARVVCLIAALFVIAPCLGLQWLRAPHDIDAGMSLLSFEACGRDFDGGERCESRSNFELAKLMRKAKQGEGTFAYAGVATLVLSVAAGLTLAAAGALAFKDRFVRKPIALTTAALLTLCLALLTACVFVGSKPNTLGVSWPFFMFAGGIVAGIAGAQMLSKAFSQVSDPYWDGTDHQPFDPV